VTDETKETNRIAKLGRNLGSLVVYIKNGIVNEVLITGILKFQQKSKKRYG
jgi:hypothetical protein